VYAQQAAFAEGIIHNIYKLLIRKENAPNTKMGSDTL
jgi:hypothetical protein